MTYLPNILHDTIDLQATFVFIEEKGPHQFLVLEHLVLGQVLNNRAIQSFFSAI